MLNIFLAKYNIRALRCGGDKKQDNENFSWYKMYVIAVYDINTETKAGRRRLRLIFKLMKRYMIRIQNSVFEGELTKAKFEELKVTVNDIIDETIDSVIFFKSRDIKWMDKDICGFEKDNTDNFL